MDRILGLLLILASEPAADRANDDARYLHGPDCGYACVFAESVRDRDQGFISEERTNSAKMSTEGSGEESLVLTQLP